jgi:hypothetical protein
MPVETQIIAETPEIEAYRLGLLKDVNEFIQKQISTGQLPPDFQVADLAGLEQQATALAEQGIGAYEPYISGGLRGIQAGQAAISGAALPTMGGALGAYQTGLGQLPGVAAQFDPTTAQAFMDPYEEQVVQQTLADLQRQSDIANLNLNAQAVGAGAFGGSRQGIQLAEGARNLQEAQARASGQLRSAGYQQSLQQAQQAFEAARQRQLAGVGLTGQLAQGMGQLGLQTGQLGGQLGALGLQEAGLGELTTNLGLSQARNLMDMGGIQRAHQQQQLDALRQTNLARQAQPYQQYAFLSDIYKGTPSGQQVITSSAAAQPSPFQTAAGFGIAGLATAAGAKHAGLF